MIEEIRVGDLGASLRRSGGGRLLSQHHDSRPPASWPRRGPV